MATTHQEQAQARRRNPRGQGDRLREEVISAASELIAESGDADRLSLRAVAKKIGIAAPSIYRHFPDAEHLKMAVVQRNFATFGAARDRASAQITDPAEALLARCRAYCQFAMDYPGSYRFMFSHQAPPADPGRPSGGPAAFQALAASIARCQDAGAARASDDPAHLAAQVWADLHGLVLLRMNLPDFPWPAPLEEMADQAVARLIMLGDSPHAQRR
jgi:AcrR family transcriptional regulator